MPAHPTRLRQESRTPLDAAIADVVEAGNCSGCGFCVALDGGIEMRSDAAGFARPVRVSLSTRDEVEQQVARRRFDAACPGRVLRAQTPTGARRHPTMGPVVQTWAARAADDEIRHRGSSGGALSALTAWLLQTGQVSRTVGARPASGDPRRTVSVTIRSRADVLESAGSRYAPVATLANPELGSHDAGLAVVGKPCEISALRADRGADAPLLLSFFCAGTPSQRATDRLVDDLGAATPDDLSAMWYRGRGWPGRFTAVSNDGSVVSATYDDSWGAHLGRDLQWRCKICPDGVGESADITAADYWAADENGYPVFAEGDGVSALIARTSRGAEVVKRAIAAGILVVEPLDIDDLARIQPLQRDRRETLLGRTVGQRAAGVRPPRYRGFGLARLALARWRDVVRTARGTYSRVRGGAIR